MIWTKSFNARDFARLLLQCDCVQVKMVTGDQYAIAVETSRRLGLGTNIMEGEELLGSKATNMEFAKHVEAMDGFAGVFPEHKHRIVEAVQHSGRLVGMTGRELP